MNDEQVIRTFCHSDCGGGCLLRVHVKNNVITRIETDDGEAPQFRACARGRAYRQRVYADDRLKYPQKRVGERGEGKFERVSWDEALDTVAGEIKRVRDIYGPEAILLYAGAGEGSWLHGVGPVARLLGLAGGYSRTYASVSYEAGIFAELATYGTPDTSNTGDDLLNSRLIILWGVDPVNTTSNKHTSWYLAQAKEAGIKIISIDPRYTVSTATLARQYIPIIPGTDAAMLIAMAFVMIEKNLQDQAFLDTYTIGFKQFKDYLLGLEDGVAKTPSWAESITGVPAATIEKLAVEYATTKPAALITGIAPGRTAYGEQHHRAAITLAAMTGNIGVHGGNAAGRSWNGGIWTPPLIKMPPLDAAMLTFNPVEDNIPKNRDALPGKMGIVGFGSVNTHQTADAILKGRSGGYPADYKLLFLVNRNWLNQEANSNKTAEALKSLEFIVDLEQQITATARFADILLPTNTFLERNDIAYGGATPVYGRQNKVIDSIGESKSHLEICSELACRMGISDFGNKTEDEWLRDSIRDSDIPSYDEFKETVIYKVKLPEPRVAFKEQIADPKNNPFPTPSGKIEIYSQRLANLNNPELPPIPKYIETWESRNDPLAKKYPLQLITTQLLRRVHSQFDNVPWLRELQTQVISINPVDAEPRGIKDGDEARVFNDRGEVIIRAEVTERIMPGVVDIPEGAWYEPDEKGRDRGGCSNVLTSDKTTPAGAWAPNTSLVQVQKS